MRIQYKGGVWKNSEDEILKAAVMKYGMNQWARIASLLVRKSAKQCKARWFEWLDPSIKKTAWTREEEERLLHLAKIMPTQWRTIAPMIGRTATQCLEHYERLLDEAQHGDAGASADGAASSAAGSAAAGARESDFAAESRPARPDPVDMDEEELEMLGEARARLANTKGKKAKRKTREKQLEEAKRLAHLQKRRELKAAGINMKPPRQSRKHADLAVEVPLMREPAAGFYDVREEVATGAGARKDVGAVGRRLDKLERKNRDGEEMRARRLDEQRRRKYEQDNPAAALGVDSKKAAPPVEIPALGAILTLPKPQVSDAELEAIAKAGAHFANKTRTASTNGITDTLVTDRNPVLATPSSMNTSVASTPRSTPAESWANARQRHVETILNLHNTDTPLMGGQNTPLVSSVTASGTPVQQTPNPLSTPSEISVLGTSSQYKKAQKVKLALMKKTVQDKLDKLSKPDFELDAMEVLLDDDNEEEEAEDVIEEDIEEEEQRLRNEGEAALKRATRQYLSSAAKRKLPLPDEAWVVKSGKASELHALALRDIAVKKALQSGEQGREAETAITVQRAGASLNQLAYMRQARTLVRKEGERGQLKESDFLRALENRKDEDDDWVIRSDGTICEVATESDRSKVNSMEQAFAASARKSESKLVKKLDILNKGYERRLETAQEAAAKAWDDIEEIEMQIACVEALEKMEKDAIDSRVAEWEAKVREQAELNAKLQKEYESLTRANKTS